MAAVTDAAGPAGTPGAVEQRIEAAVDAALAAEGLTRRHWQTLHALAFGGMDAFDLRDVLAPFGGPVDVGPVVEDLRARGWVERDPGGLLGLSPDGRVADGRLFELVAGLRRTAGRPGPAAR